MAPVNRATLRLLAVVVLLTAGACRRKSTEPVVVAEPTATPTPAPTPTVASEWNESYKRFASFIESRKANWPQSGLTISPTGVVDFTLTVAESRTEHIGLDIYHGGVRVLSTLLPTAEARDLFNRKNFFLPGDYIIYLQSSGVIGYQTHFPLVYFKVEETPAEAARRSPAPRVQVIAAPEKPERLWPNEQMQLFRDFQTFGGKNPDEIHKGNDKVARPILLSVTKSGTVKRQIVPDSGAEALLSWRIYHDGRLVDSSAAAGQDSYSVKQGVGSYAICLVVNGPHGVMPVSNLLEFPLFPVPGSTPVIMPEMHDKYTPVFLKPTRDLIEQQQLSDFSDLPPEDRKLWLLWRAWGFEIEHPNLFTIHLVDE
jgi:hypothetical protein